MPKRVTWKENALICLKLRDNLFTIAQMLRSPFLRLFKVSNKDGVWRNLDLNEVEVLSCVLVGQVVLQQLCEGKVRDRAVIPSSLPFQKLWMRPYMNLDGGFPFIGARLVEVDPTKCVTTAPVVRDWLRPKADAELIKKYELTNMWGADDLRERLVRYFDTGIDRNALKEKVFDFSLRGNDPTDGGSSAGRDTFGPPPGAFERE